MIQHPTSLKRTRVLRSIIWTNKNKKELLMCHHQIQTSFFHSSRPFIGMMSWNFETGANSSSLPEQERSDQMMMTKMIMMMNWQLAPSSLFASFHMKCADHLLRYRYTEPSLLLIDDSISMPMMMINKPGQHRVVSVVFQFAIRIRFFSVEKITVTPHTYKLYVLVSSCPDPNHQINKP